MAIAGYTMGALNISWEGYGDKSIYSLIEET